MIYMFEGNLRDDFFQAECDLTYAASILTYAILTSET